VYMGRTIVQLPHAKKLWVSSFPGVTVFFMCLIYP